MAEIKAAERRQYSSQGRPANPSSQSPFLVTTTGIPHAAVKPQRRDDLSTQIHHEDETKNHSKSKQSDSETEAQSPRRRKKKRKSHKEDNIDKSNNGHVKKTDELDVHNQNITNGDGSDQERPTTKERRSKKKRSEKRHSQDETGSEKDVVAEEAAQLDNISSKLPSPKHIDQRSQGFESDSNEERQTTKERKRRKKRHRRKVESPVSQENDESEEDTAETAGPVGTVESDDILSRLPPPRKLPPLRT
ncbi:uncharacterized protein DDB_G0283697 [Exaiptasia diaphana]|uniref:Uncharacterized protein n=1 Tax=Exaiptasia diaphana TaxID=2652724 RepID=A0A913XRA5_EXADI|nr:uncharacterized protein DDB_G0283697 [Exaiptasia diaphana]